MSRRRKSRKAKSNNKKMFNIITIISIIIAIIFGIMLYALDMVPEKYLLIIYAVSILLYLVLTYLVFKKNIKSGIKIFCIVLFIIFDILFGIGIKYISKTISFVDVINNELFQKEEFYIMVLKDSNIKELEELSNKNIGIYSSLNSDKAIETLGKKVKTTEKKYTDTMLMFDDLNDNKIEAVLITSSIKNLFGDELKDTASNLRELYVLSVPIKKADTEVLKVVDVTRKPFNIYVAGGDAYGSIDKVTNTDVNMIITVDPVNKKILLTSIPRDYYVNLPSFGEDAYDKLTHAGYYGIEESIKTIEKLLDIDINYYVKVNFSTIEGIVDAVGGVDVESDYNFCVEGRRCFKKGINHLDGASALTFARERHSFADGDIQRVKNQQYVITALINKITSSYTLVSKYSNILAAVKDSIVISMDEKSINKFIKMQLNDMTAWNMESQNLIGTGASKVTYTFPSMQLYVMLRNEESVNEAKEKIREVKR